MKITFEDILLAYQRAKADIYYEKNNDDLIQFGQFEYRLEDNLNEILYQLNQKNFSFFLSDDTIGGYSISIKNIVLETDHEQVLFADELERFERAELKNIELRYVGRNSVAFHIISSLWIDKIGSVFESKINPFSYGCRLNRIHRDADKKDNYPETKGSYPVIGNFEPYAYNYKKWQQDNLEAAKNALSLGKNIIVFATDIKSFYHSITPTFVEIYFHKQLSRGLIDDNYYFINQLLLEMLSKWDFDTKEGIKDLGFNLINDTAGLPIGLSASKVIANLVLNEFDLEITNKLNPIFYGRYVDDILLVIERKKHLLTKTDIWKFLADHIDNLRFNSSKQISSYSFLEELDFDLLIFNDEKTRVFSLSSKSGESVIDSMKKSMNENSSEWRLMPDAEDDLENLNEEIISSANRCEDFLTNFSKFDGVSVQRFKFALRLRNFETLVRTTEKEVWEESLVTFYNTVNEFIITPLNFNKFINYFPRLFGLLVYANKSKEFYRLSETYFNCWRLITEKYQSTDYYKPKIINELTQYYESLIRQNILCSINFLLDEELYNWLSKTELFEISSNRLIKLSQRLFYSDFHKVPLKMIFFNEKYAQTTPFPNNLKNRLLGYPPINRSSDIKAFIKKSKVKHIREIHLILSIRQLTSLEISFICNPFNDQYSYEEFKKTLSAFGYSLNPVDFKPNNSKTPDEYLTLDFKSKLDRNPNIILTNLHTEDSSWLAIVRDDGFEPDVHREVRLNRLVNDILRVNKPIDFVIFPELSIPRHRIIEIAEKLRSKGISIVAGLEYEIQIPDNQNDVSDNTKHVINQLIYVITRSEDNHNSQIGIRQDKTIPAYHEEDELYKVGNKRLVYNSDKKYIIKHKDIVFSGLICNDLLNIDNRQPLRGEIDLLFVVEWNKDVDMYNHIVSSTSNDLHCFVAQVNNRSYGNTLLRGPYRESYKRDVANIKGGELDSFVLVKVEANELREFQRNHRSPKEPFKPVPTGFVMSELRRDTRISKKK